MKLVEEVKSHSSRWIKLNDENCVNFYWQHGYAGFSVDKSRIEQLKRYIGTQKQHHQQKDFQREYLKLLVEHNIEYDERYMWD